MKHIIISVGLFLVSSLASANLLQNNIVSAVASTAKMNMDNSPITNMNQQAFSAVVNLGFKDKPTNKVEAIYSNLFEYSSKIHTAAIDNELSTLWNNALSRTVNPAVHSEQTLLKPSIENNPQDILQYMDINFSDYATDENRINPPINAVPLPAAIWLFSSALLLFGFARRSSI